MTVNFALSIYPTVLCVLALCVAFVGACRFGYAYFITKLNKEEKKDA